MILPIKPWKTVWFLYWLDLEEPVPFGSDFILPTVFIVGNEKGMPLAPPEIMEEIDQAKVEDILIKLIDKLGIPDRLVVDISDEWDEESWRLFSEDYRIEILFQKLSWPILEEAGSTLAKSVTQHFEVRSSLPKDIARGLVNVALRVRSVSKKTALLKKAIERDPDCSRARIELADTEFHSGNWQDCLSYYKEIIACESIRWEGKKKLAWWKDEETRPYLRAIFGKAMALWHQEEYAEAAKDLSYLLKLNPTDNQGVRFVIPILWMLAEDYPKAQSFYEFYAAHYKDDYADPAFLFVWGLVLYHQGYEKEARAKYREGIFRNLYIAPLLLGLPSPPHHIWHPHNRAEPGYAKQFLDYHASFWERDPSSLRLLRDTWKRNAKRIQKIIDLRTAIIEFQDQRFDPVYRKKWHQFLRQEERLSGG